jgi:amidase
MPASACGLFGLKPSRGRNPSGPDVGEDWGGLIANHCVSISVRDSAALLDATSAPDVGDPYWAPPPAGKFLDEVGLVPRALRIALCINPWNGEPVDRECRQAAEDAARLCEALGHHVTIARPEFDFASFGAAVRIIVAANLRAALAARAAVIGKTLEPTDVEPLVWPTAERGRICSAVDYVAAVTTVQRTSRAVARFFTGYDILLTPTMCSPPTELGVQSLSNPNPDAFLVATRRSFGFTSLFNASGNPAMSVPLHWTASGLPVGVQFVAPFGDEPTLFRLAAQLEIARPWKDRRPPLIP